MYMYMNFVYFQAIYDTLPYTDVQADYRNTLRDVSQFFTFNGIRLHNVWFMNNFHQFYFLFSSRLEEEMLSLVNNWKGYSQSVIVNVCRFKFLEIIYPWWRYMDLNWLQLLMIKLMEIVLQFHYLSEDYTQCHGWLCYYDNIIKIILLYCRWLREYTKDLKTTSRLFKPIKSLYKTSTNSI